MVQVENWLQEDPAIKVIVYTQYEIQNGDLSTANAYIHL